MMIHRRHKLLRTIHVEGLMMAQLHHNKIGLTFDGAGAKCDNDPWGPAN